MPINILFLAYGSFCCSSLINCYILTLKVWAIRSFLIIHHVVLNGNFLDSKVFLIQETTYSEILMILEYIIFYNNYNVGLNSCLQST